MALIGHSNWPSLGGTVLSGFFDDDRFSTRSSIFPAVTIKENDKSFEVAAPGFEKSDFDLDIDNDLLIVAAEQQEENERKDGNFVGRELGYSSSAVYLISQRSATRRLFVQSMKMVFLTI